MTGGIWVELASLNNPELQQLAASLPATLLDSQSDNTEGKYGQAFKRWKVWADSREEVSIFPVEEVHFALYMYLQHLGEKKHPWSAVQEVVNVIGWVHQLSGLEPVTQLSFIQATVEGLKRIWPNPKVKKEPVTVDMLAT